MMHLEDELEHLHWPQERKARLLREADCAPYPLNYAIRFDMRIALIIDMILESKQPLGTELEGK